MTFNLNKNIYESYRKPDNQLVYINANSNHTPNTIRELPISIGKVIQLPCNKEVFEKETPPYSDALKESGFKEDLVYTPKTITNNILDKKRRKRKIIWFNPPYWVNVKTNIGKIILSLLKKHFPKKNKLHKIFNKNNIKISCMMNISSIKAGDDKSLLQPKITKYGCNCRVKNTCPIQNQWQIPNLIYRAPDENEANDEKKIYFGLAATTFKERSGNYRSKNTELSKYI